MQNVELIQQPPLDDKNYDVSLMAIGTNSHTPDAFWYTDFHSK